MSLSLWKDTTFCIHCSPVVGLSGWMYMRFGISGSALPATIHRLQREYDDISSYEWMEWSGVGREGKGSEEGKRGIEIGMLANRHLFHLNEHHSALRFGVTSWELALPSCPLPPLKFSSCMHIDDRTRSPIVEFVSVVV